MSSFNPALLRLIYLEMGIVPNISLDKDGDELKNMLDQLTPEEARKCKRKFRKIHRKLRKQRIKKTENSKSRKDILRKFGNCNKEPDNLQRRRRRDIVRSYVRNQPLTKWNDE